MFEFMSVLSQSSIFQFYRVGEGGEQKERRKLHLRLAFISLATWAALKGLERGDGNMMDIAINLDMYFSCIKKFRKRRFQGKFQHSRWLSTILCELHFPHGHNMAAMPPKSHFSHDSLPGRKGGKRAKIPSD